MEKFKSEKLSSVPASEEALASRERELEWPLISKEEALFVSRTGGRYHGYVQSESGREYKDSLAHRWSYFDPEQRKVIETYFEIEATDGENDAIANPREARGFKGMIAKLDASGTELDEPFFIDMYPEYFPNAKMNLAKLRVLAGEVFDYTKKNAEKNQRELTQGVRMLLEERGWRERTSSEH